MSAAAAADSDGVAGLADGAGADLLRAAAGTLLASFAGDHVPDWVVRRVDGGLGGICLYGSNRGADVAAVAGQLHARRADVVVALDEEGGDVTRLEVATGSSVPGNAALGAIDDPDLTRQVAAALGAVLRSVGVDLDLAPCADVNSDPTNPVVGVRSFGADPHLVARHTSAFVTGLQSAGVAACAKHFPGHGAVAVDSHLALPTVTTPLKVLQARELAPFRAAVAAGVAAVMPGHLLVPALDDMPATVSPRVVTGVLRGDLAFEGLVVTDALDMGGIGGPAAIPANVVRALAAGADLCCLGPDNDDALVDACIEVVAAAVAAGTLPAERVAEAAARVASLRSVASALPGASASAELASLSVSGAGKGRQKSGAQPGGGGLACDEDLAVLGAEAARRAVRVDGRLPTPLLGAHVVELDRPANIAAGSVPWGVGAALGRIDPAASTTRAADGEDAAIAAALRAAVDRPLVVVVRDPQRRPAQAAALDTLLSSRPDAVVVDMGWPGERAARPPAGAWLTTFGASRASGVAAARLLVGTDARRPSVTSASTIPGRTSRG